MPTTLEVARFQTVLTSVFAFWIVDDEHTHKKR